jgi:hypothetical protein
MPKTWVTTGNLPGRGGAIPAPDRKRGVDRRLAQRNLRTALIAGAIALLLFGASFLAAEIYLS